MVLFAGVVIICFLSHGMAARTRDPHNEGPIGVYIRAFFGSYHVIPIVQLIPSFPTEHQGVDALPRRGAHSSLELVRVQRASWAPAVPYLARISFVHGLIWVACYLNQPEPTLL